MPDVVLSVNGTDYAGWKGISVGRGLESLSGSFSLSVSERWTAEFTPPPIAPEDTCQVFLHGIPVITGYVDTASPGFSPDDLSFEVSGRDKTCDLVDCSAIVDSFEFKNLTVADMARALCDPFGIRVVVETAVGDAFKRHSVQPGETAWDCLERAALQRGILCTTNGRGDLVLATPGSKRASDRLVQGKNLINAKVIRDHRNRYSRYLVNGQEPSWYVGETEPNPAITGKAEDKNVKRYRPLLINAEMNCDCQTAQQRAENEATIRAGRATALSVLVQDWKQSNDELWEHNMTVTVTAPRLQIHDVVFITDSLMHGIDDRNGTITQMTLLRPDAFLRNCSGKVKNDWFD